MTTLNGASVSLGSEAVETSQIKKEAVTEEKLSPGLKESGAVTIAAEPKAEPEITESGAGNGIKEPSATKPTFVYVKWIQKAEAWAVKVEHEAVIVANWKGAAAGEGTASFLVAKGKKFKVTFSGVEKVIPTYHIL
jgi:hypothetical protein